MNIISLTEVQPKEIASALREGSTIIYPTETCYGLGCDATNQESVDRIFSIKQRQKDKALLVVMPSIEMARKYVVWTETIDMLAMNYWPGPMTVVAQAKEENRLASGVIAADGTVAFRVTGHPAVIELSSTLGKPLVSTSANISAQESPYDITSVRAMFDDAAVQPDIIIDAGELPPQAPSTIVKVEDEQVIMLRQGELIVSL